GGTALPWNFSVATPDPTSSLDVRNVGAERIVECLRFAIWNASAGACGHHPRTALRQAHGVLLIRRRRSRWPHHHTQRAQGPRIAARQQQHLAPRDDPPAAV